MSTRLRIPEADGFVLTPTCQGVSIRRELATLKTLSVCPVSVCRCVPVRTSRKLTVLPAALTNVFPLGLKAIFNIARLFSSRICRNLPVLGSHRRTVSSIAPTCENVSIRTEHDACDRTSMPFKGVQVCPGSHIPQPHGMVVTSTCENVSIRTEHDTCDPKPMSCESSYVSTGVYVPETDAPAPTSRSNNVSVRRKHDAKDPKLMSFKGTKR